ncbi:prolyl-tRNA synthetase associated domain-containing protein [Xiamenia xianingshaonis]|uniref:Prolyl-tRNA synthetase associated domain-containing protein n=1 Tax=Xiamenia xianingshaonis TaxID=2682776 RepID=A0ABX0IK70_9ACTN|nr:prolyl-tRNA synthetase associated domain-containing protein [Xiamenia xianingshaonis]NHM13528.1 prolyl-tRNA synthetase associated domain-containing protein [Xiamenia xianingshaonis]
MTYGKAEVTALLDERGVAYEKVEHEAVFTMEGMDALGLPFADEVVKNLFLRDDKKRAYYLVTMVEDKPANLKALRRTIESRPLRFASEDDLNAILGLRGGAVSPFGVLNDVEHKTEVVFDKALRSYSGLGVHPNDNTATLHVPLDDVLALLEDFGVPYRFVDMTPPEAEEPAAQ